MGRKLGCAAAPLPVTDDLAARIVRFPRSDTAAILGRWELGTSNVELPRDP